MEKNFNEMIDVVLAGIRKLPNPPRDKVELEFLKMKEMIVDSRPPRVMVFGRRGAGKSSLLNAIFKAQVAKTGSVTSQTGASTWHTYKGAKGSMDIMDTRGAGDHTRPEDSLSDDFIDDIRPCVVEKCPDVILFLCKAKEVDAHIKEDLNKVKEIQAFIRKERSYEIPVIAVVTQVDELDPKRDTPPFSNATKQANIVAAQSALRQALKDCGIAASHLTAISAYAEFDDTGAITHQEFWQIDELVSYLSEELPLSAQLQFARLSALKSAQHKLATILIGTAATVCAAIAGTPIPVADIIPITATQVAMVTGIGYVGGQELNKEAAIHFMASLGLNVGAGYALREAARALIKFVPIGGELVSSGIAAAGTWTLGKAAAAYFIDHRSHEEAVAEANRSAPPEHVAEPVIV